MEDQLGLDLSSEAKNQKINSPQRPALIRGVTRCVKTGCGNLYVTINDDETGKPVEVFTNMGKSGQCVSLYSEAVARLISLSLKLNAESYEEIISELRGISCQQPAWGEGGKVVSCLDAIANALDKYYHNSDKGTETVSNTNALGGMHAGACPDCGSPVIYEEGCLKCFHCFYSKCG